MRLYELNLDDENPAYWFVDDAPTSNVELVECDGQTIGWWDLRNTMSYDLELELKEVAYPIVLSIMVTGDTPVIDVIERLAQATPEFLFVVENGSITGIVGYNDLFGPVGSLCLLALTFELEGAALRLCQAFPMDCFQRLPAGRFEKAIEVFNVRSGQSLDAHFDKMREDFWNVPPDVRIARLFKDILECTTFIDKCKMINGCKLLVDWSASKVKQVFARAERVRNACAHPPGPSHADEVLRRGQLAEFVRECRLLTDSIIMVTPQGDVQAASE